MACITSFRMWEERRSRTALSAPSYRPLPRNAVAAPGDKSRPNYLESEKKMHDDVSAGACASLCWVRGSSCALLACRVQEDAQDACRHISLTTAAASGLCIGSAISQLHAEAVCMGSLPRQPGLTC